MYCNKCGNQLPDNAKFCNACGAELSVSEEQNIEVTAAGEETSVATMEAPAETILAEPEEEVLEAVEDSLGNEETEETEEDGGIVDLTEEKPDKKKITKKHIIIGSICGVVVLLGILGFALKNIVFYAVAPEKYTANLIANTFEEMIDEMDDIEENVFGFNVGMDEDFTVGIEYSGKEDYENGGETKFNIAVANSSSGAEMLADGSYEIKGTDENKKVNVQAFWNDENIGFAVPQQEDVYYVAPSKTFGEALMGSDYGADLRSNGVDLSSLDLSYTNVKKILSSDSDELENVKEKIEDEFIALLKNSDLSDRKSVAYKIGDDEVSAKRIIIDIDGDDLNSCMANCLEVLADDEYLRGSIIGDGTRSEFKRMASQLRNTSTEEEFQVIIIEYDGRVAEFTVLEGSNRTTISSTDEDYVLNGLKIETQSEYGTQSSQFSSNWVSEDEEIYFEIVNKYDGSENSRTEAQLNFNTGKFKVTVNNYGSISSINGKCSKNDGFNLSIDNMITPQGRYVSTYSMEYDEWFDENFKNTDYRVSSYYYDNDKYDDLWDIYYDDYWYDYDTYADWYDALGSNYDSSYVSYDEWLTSVYYNDEDVRSDYEYECGTEEWAEYDFIENIKITVKEGVSVTVKDRQHKNLFEQDFTDGQMMW